MMDQPLWTTILGIVSPITAVFAGYVSVSVYFANRQHGKRQWTLDLHQTYHSAKYGEARWQAKLLLQKYAPASLERIDDLETRLLTGPEGFDRFAQVDGLLLIFQFWNRLGIALKHEWADERAMVDLFSYEFGWWYGYVIVELTRQPDGRRSGEIHDLARWLDKQNRASARRPGNSFRTGFEQGKARRQLAPD